MLSYPRAFQHLTFVVDNGFFKKNATETAEDKMAKVIAAHVEM